MSDFLMDMQQRRTVTALPNVRQYKSKHNSQIDNDANGIYNNNKFSCGSSRTPDTVCLSQYSTTTADTMTTSDNEGNVDISDQFENVLRLQLRKPKHWRWELSTSRSCSNIVLPRILLYDHKGQLLVDANSQVEQCYSELQRKHTQKDTHRKPTHAAPNSQSINYKRTNRALTTSLTQTIRQALDQQFSGLQIQEATPSPIPSHNCSTETEQTTTPTSAIEFYTNELPDYQRQRRTNSLKGVRFKVNDEPIAKIDANAYKSIQNALNLADLPTPPSTITTTTTPTNSSSSGPREKRRYRHSHSSGRSPATSESILERFSLNKGRFSSPEYTEEHEVHHAPRYFLRTSKAGTLVVQEESFSGYRRRRRPRNTSTENLHSGTGSGSKSSLKISDSTLFRKQLTKFTANREPREMSCVSLLNEVDLEAQVKCKKVYPVRRYLSDGNVLLQQACSSDEEQKKTREYDHTRVRNPKIAQLSQRKYVNQRKQSKRELITIDPENSVQPGAFSTESR